MIIGVGLLAIILIGAGLGTRSWAAGYKESNTSINSTTGINSITQKLEAAGSQLEALMQLGTKNTNGSFTSVVKWQGAWNHTPLSTVQAALELASALGLPAPLPEQVQDHKVYAAEGTLSGIAAKLSVMETDEGLYLVMLLEGTSEAAEAMKKAQEQAGRALLKAGVEADWNGAVQGFASKQRDVLGTDAQAGETASGMLSRIETSVQASGLQAEVLDDYADGTTVSRTYEVPSFSLVTSMSDGRNIGLQIGVHADTESGREQISIGSPMLTIEY